MIKILIFLFSILIYTPTARAYEEIWGTLVLRQSINDEQQMVGEWRRRDSENLVFAGNSSDIFRLSLSTKFESFTYLAGVSYANFEINPSHEFRLHQFLFFKLLDEQRASLVARIGTEHRDFRQTPPSITVFGSNCSSIPFPNIALERASIMKRFLP